MSQKSLFEVLGLKPSCTYDEVDKAWKEAETKYAVNSKLYTDAQHAYRTLIDPVKHELYCLYQVTDDNILSKHINLSSLLQDNKSCKEYERIMTKQTKLTIDCLVSLEDFFKGKTFNFSRSCPIICKQCKTSAGSLQVSCFNCKRYPQLLPSCGVCLGTGKYTVHTKQCEVCKGKKSVEEVIKIQFDVKRGMYDGQRLRRTVVTSVTSSPIELSIILKQKSHPYFKRQGDNLHIVKRIGINEALCGCKFVIDHLDGRKLYLSTVGSVLSPGCVRTISGGGMPKEKSECGDLFVHFQIIFPPSLPVASVKEVESCLPDRPFFEMPSDPMTEEYQLSEYDPNYQLSYFTRNNETYHDDKHDKQYDFDHKEQCPQQ